MNLWVDWILVEEDIPFHIPVSDPVRQQIEDCLERSIVSQSDI